MKNNTTGTLFVITLVWAGLAGGLKSAEPQFKLFSTKVVSALHHDEKMQTLFDIELDDGRRFTVNNDHPMYVIEDDEFTFTDELAARFAKGESITFQDSKNQPVRIASLGMRREICKVYNLHVEGQGKEGHTYYANGILVHNTGRYKFK